MRRTAVRISFAIWAMLCGLMPVARAAVHPDSRPITPEELALKQSTVEPADAEALFREVWIEEHASTTYVRFKIFNSLGREKYSDVKIEYPASEAISGVCGRTIHADGTITELQKDAIFDKVEAKKGRLKVKVLSFAMPVVESGSLIEYQWTERNSFEDFIPLEVQSEYPAREVTFHIKLGSALYTSIKLMSFGCKPKQDTKDARGSTTITVRNVPAYHDEPYSPPELSARMWILGSYQFVRGVWNGDSWWAVGKYYYAREKETIKITREMKEVVNSVISKGKTDEEKLELLADYCRNNIQNLWSRDITTEEREQFKRNKNTANTFKRGAGIPEDIDLLFVGLARTAGFEAHVARVADRKAFLFDTANQSRFFLDNQDAAVLVNGRWIFYDVTNKWTPPGRLQWLEQGVWALVPQEDGFLWERTPLLTVEDTKMQRIGDFELSVNGDLEGYLREINWGNKSFNFRKAHDSETDAERQEFVRNEVKKSFPGAEVTNVNVSILADAKNPPDSHATCV